MQVTDVKLYSGVPMTPNNQIQIDFPNIESREIFLDEFLFRVLKDVTYIRENGTLRVDGNVDTFLGVNYVEYKNQNKTYFAYVKDVVYISDELTALVLQTDYFQTYYGEYQIPSARVLREHRNRYKKINNVLYPVIDNIPEDIGVSPSKRVTNLGNIINENEVESDGIARPHLWAIIKSNKKFPNTPDFFMDGLVYTYLAYVPLSSQSKPVYMETTKLPELEKSVHEIPKLTDFMYGSVGNAKTLYDYAIAHDGTISVTLTPFLPFGVKKVQFTSGGVFYSAMAQLNSTLTVTDVVVYESPYHQDQMIAQLNINPQYLIEMTNDEYRKFIINLSDLIPDSNLDPKLYHSDFTTYMLTDYQNEKELQLENVYWNDEHNLYINYIYHNNIDNGYTISIDGINGNNKTIANYEQNVSISRGLNFDLITDEYLAYKRNQQAQDITNDVIGMVMSVLGIVGGAVATMTGVGTPIGIGAIIGGATSLGASAIKMGVSQDMKSKLGTKPSKLGNEIGMVQQKQMGMFRMLKIEKGSEQERNAIDNYFKRFGYKTNDPRPNPTWNSRKRFNYIQMDDIIITGEIPNQAKDSIIDMFKSGITIFHAYQNIIDIEFETSNEEVLHG